MLYYKVPLDPKRYGIQFPSHNYVNWRKQMKLKKPIECFQLHQLLIYGIIHIGNILAEIRTKNTDQIKLHRELDTLNILRTLASTWSAATWHYVAYQ